MSDATTDVAAGDEQGEGGVGAEQFRCFQEAVGAFGKREGVELLSILLCGHSSSNSLFSVLLYLACLFTSFMVTCGILLRLLLSIKSLILT